MRNCECVYMCDYVCAACVSVWRKCSTGFLECKVIFSCLLHFSSLSDGRRFLCEFNKHLEQGKGMAEEGRAREREVEVPLTVMANFLN